jgi:hypothetical protein
VLPFHRPRPDFGGVPPIPNKSTASLLPGGV